MPIQLRDGELPPDDVTLIVHMGAGDRVRLCQTVIDHYDEYRALREDGYGYFALSVYAAHHGRSVEAIRTALPWTRYATCTAGEVRRYFDLLATTVLDDDGEPLDELQEVHFDLLLPHPGDVRLRVPDVLFDDERGGGVLVDTEEWLQPHLERFCLLFEPRIANERSTLDDGGER